MSTQPMWHPQPLVDEIPVVILHDKLGRLIVRDGVYSPAPEPIRKPTRTMGWGDCRHREGRTCRNCM